MWSARHNRRWPLAAAVVLALAVAIGATTAVTLSSSRQSERIASAITGGEPRRAPAIMRQYGCGGCHTIAGIPGADGQVGPPLSGLINRVYVGGVAFNSPDNLIQWIVEPRTLSPRTAMPDTGISEAEARDVAAYLYAH
ncbi:MAG TPA: c-type cytochrome [Bradyrhizobium sp.]|uniref:c-type cytochrome n=1 Tax=Bradyrhizobium sp. TaxID=376 RepID=UPI002D804BBC|nr:c-type cytochrome [Bradyrhizobium sp.]HET7888343.1 c-type cytochrome [Bradyrhizobium sp.]